MSSPDQWVVTAVMADKDGGVGRVAGIDDLARGVECVSNRFFDQDRHALLNAVYGLTGVFSVRCGNDCTVYPLALQ